MCQNHENWLKTGRSSDILRMMRRILISAVIWLTFAGASSAFAQLQPVDQAVGDLDRLSTSLRHVQPGLRHDGEQTSLYTTPQASPASLPSLNKTYSLTAPVSQHPAYLRVGPGFTAQMDRPDYIVRRGRKGTASNIAPRRDGEFAEVIPANTVFIINPNSQAPVAAPTNQPQQEEEPQQSQADQKEPLYYLPGQKELLEEKRKQQLRKQQAAKIPWSPYRKNDKPVDASVNRSVNRMVNGRVSNRAQSNKISDNPYH